MRAGIIIGCVLLVFGLVAASGKLMGAYQQLTVEQSDIQARWKQLDKDMKVRADMVPRLENSAAVARQSSLKAEIENSRTALSAASTKQDKMRANAKLSSAVDRTIAVSPDLDQRLLDDLADAEQTIANDKKDYNDAIQKYNTDLQLFPKNLVASLFHFQRDDDYFRTPENENK